MQGEARAHLGHRMPQCEPQASGPKSKELGVCSGEAREQTFHTRKVGVHTPDSTSQLRFQ